MRIAYPKKYPISCSRGVVGACTRARSYVDNAIESIVIELALALIIRYNPKQA